MRVLSRRLVSRRVRGRPRTTVGLALRVRGTRRVAAAGRRGTRVRAAGAARRSRAVGAVVVVQARIAAAVETGLVAPAVLPARAIVAVIGALGLLGVVWTVRLGVVAARLVVPVLTRAAGAVLLPALGGLLLRLRRHGDGGMLEV
jgi:hypothetical protein